MKDVDWGDRAGLGELRAVIDPADLDGVKNRLIDRIQWNRLRGTLRDARRVLDVGCGTGRFARKLTRCGLQYVGIDTSSGMITAAQRLNAANGVTFLVFDGRAIPAAAMSFDLCITVGVLQYLVHEPAAQLLLQEIRRVLRSGGRLTMIEQASRSGRSSGSVTRAATDHDYVALLAPLFDVRKVSWVRSCDFSSPTRALLRMGRRGPLGSAFVLNAVANVEARWLSWRGESYLRRLDYGDVLIEAVAL